MKIKIHEPYLNIVDLKTIHEATITVPNNGDMTIEELRKHIDVLQKAFCRFSAYHGNHLLKMVLH